MSGLADWTRSTACSMGTCVEARLCDGHIELRDTRQPGGRILAIELDDWNAFLDGVKNGEFDPPGTEGHPVSVGCPHPDTWADPTVCPAPCGLLHTRCGVCHAALQPCPWETK